MQKEFKVNIDEDKLIQSILDYVTVAKNYYVDVLKPKFERCYDLYNGKFDNVLYNSPSGSYVSKDIQVTIHSIIPDIIKLVFTDEPVKVSAQGVEDMELANKMQILLNYQVCIQNNYAEIMEKVSIASLITGMSVLKCVWDKRIEKEIVNDIIDEIKLNTLINQGVKIKNSSFAGQNEYLINYYQVEYEIDKVVKNQPVYNFIDYREFLFDPTALNIEDVKYYIHRRLVTSDFLRRQADLGVYDKNSVSYIIDKQINIGMYSVSCFDDDDNIDYLNYTTNNENNTALNTVMLYEYWGQYDINQDGYLENVIITFVGDKILNVQENKYGMYPFFIFNPFYNLGNISGIGISELIEPVQNIKTVLTREYLLNIRKNNNRKIFYKLDNFINPLQLETDEQYVALNENSDPRNVFTSEPYETFSNQTQNLITYFDRESQRITGISDIKSGVRSAGNQTATEATIKFEASNSQIQLIAVHFSQSMKKLYKFIINQNKQYLDNSITLRLFNRDISINPFDFSNIDFDLDVSVNLGGGTKETRLNIYQTAYKMLGELMQLGLTDNIKIRNIVAKMLDEMGLKDVDSYIISETELLEKQRELKLQEQQALINNQNLIGNNIDFPDMNTSNNKLPLQV